MNAGEGHRWPSVFHKRIVCMTDQCRQRCRQSISFFLLVCFGSPGLCRNGSLQIVNKKGRSLAWHSLQLLVVFSVIHVSPTNHAGR